MEIKKIVTAFLAASGLVSCGKWVSPNCSEYMKITSDAEKRTEILKWADESIFSANKDGMETGFSYLVGPGKERIKTVNGKAVVIPDAIVSVDSYFKKESPNVLLVEKKDGVPSVVFVGLKSFEGLLVSRGNMDDYFRRVGENKQWIPIMHDRIAVMCYSN
ncbi:MAG: hypothetical protein JNN30_05505 [Rhodanobacteraceae bacterium]|nr:hypothetical protein [Rhodanobacteraceae bacterium]